MAVSMQAGAANGESIHRGENIYHRYQPMAAKSGMAAADDCAAHARLRNASRTCMPRGAGARCGVPRIRRAAHALKCATSSSYR